MLNEHCCTGFEDTSCQLKHLVMGKKYPPGGSIGYWNVEMSSVPTWFNRNICQNIIFNNRLLRAVTYIQVYMTHCKA